MIIPILHADRELQINDLTRFDASKTVLVKGSAHPIKSVAIKPEETASYVEVFETDPRKWFLDFAYNSDSFDIDSENNAIDFDYQGARISVTVAENNYLEAALLTAIKNAIETGAPGLTATITKDARRRVVFTASDSSFKVYAKGLMVHLGFSKDGLVGNPLEYVLKKATLKIETKDTLNVVQETATISATVKVYSVEGDALFSNDSHLIAHESDIMKWLPSGRGSFNYLHRRAQKLILDWVDQNGYVTEDRERIQKHNFVDSQDVVEWSTFLALRLFFSDAQNASNDVFKEKAALYEKNEIGARKRVVLRLDLNNDGEPDTMQKPDPISGRLFFR